MCNFSDSPWIQNANTFLTANQAHPDERWYTVNFLISNNYCSIKNRTIIKNILSYLDSQGFNLSREEFQQKILSKLKREGVLTTLVYPSSLGGVFIPSNEEEVRLSVSQILDRIYFEIENIKSVTKQTSFGSLFVLLGQIVNWIRGNL